MKLSDCKPGVRVRIYDSGGVLNSSIDCVKGRFVFVVMYSKGFYPQQLRKLVKRKRPEIMYSFNENGTWCGSVHKIELVEQMKAMGKTVWLMRGVKKL